MPVSVKNTPPEKETRGNISFKNTRSEAGQEFVLLSCRAKARVKGVICFTDTDITSHHIMSCLVVPSHVTVLVCFIEYCLGPIVPSHVTVLACFMVCCLGVGLLSVLVLILCCYYLGIVSYHIVLSCVVLCCIVLCLELT